MAAPQRVKDIFRGLGGSGPTDLVSCGGLLFFVADDGLHGRELWRSDGTEAGTSQLLDLNPGGGSSDPAELRSEGGLLVFSADDGSGNGNGSGSGSRGLWQSDGSAAGTLRRPAPAPSAPFLSPGPVAPPTPGWPSIDPATRTSLSGSVFFAANDGSSGYELWRSDGPGGQPVRVADLNPGNAGSGPSDLTTMGESLYFVADDGSSGRELWRTDASGAPPVRVADLQPGSGGANPGFLTTVGQTLFFAANDGSSGYELWRSDGVGAAPVQVVDLNPGRGGSYPSFLTAVGSWLLFSANDGSSGYELWCSDGSAAGTLRLADLNPGSASANPGLLTALGDRLFFAADDGSSGEELWSLDISGGLVDPLLSISAISADRLEGNAGANAFSFRVSRSGPGSTSVAWAVSGRGADPASATDFSGGVFPAGVLVFAAGETEKIITLAVATDLFLEADEGFSVELSAPTGGRLDPAASSAAGTIRNDDSNRWLVGTALADSLTGGSGDDHLQGLAGNDSLDGGSGDDTLDGGAGNDVYWLDSLADQILDSSGVDTIRSPLSCSLVPWAAIENLWLQGSAVQASGNALNNRLYGNALANRLDGGAGADTMQGAGGADTYTVDDPGDVIIETAAIQSGMDTIRASVSYSLPVNVEHLLLSGSAAIHGLGNGLGNRLYGNSAANSLSGEAGDDDIRGANGNDTLIGGTGADSLSGQAADDLLIGGAGNDTLSGGAGADRFRFDGPSGGGVDLIVDFNGAEGDRIELDGAGFPALGPSSLEPGPLSGAAFTSGSAFTSPSQRLLFTGSELLYDPDGSGPEAAVPFATLTAGTVLTAAQVVVI